MVGTERRIRAEFDNPDFKLSPGLKVQMTIYLTDDLASRIPQPALAEPGHRWAKSTLIHRIFPEDC